mmetsp:Transcript_867/g.1791  ORF Transcript_867/g.1791 Transcript_867/m.1791 type:complete len:207 (+) Transcript_867:24-644(+)
MLSEVDMKPRSVAQMMPCSSLFQNLSASLPFRPRYSIGSVSSSGWPTFASFRMASVRCRVVAAKVNSTDLARATRYSALSLPTLRSQLLMGWNAGPVYMRTAMTSSSVRSRSLSLYDATPTADAEDPAVSAAVHGLAPSAELDAVLCICISGMGGAPGTLNVDLVCLLRLFKRDISPTPVSIIPSSSARCRMKSLIRSTKSLSDMP